LALLWGGMVSAWRSVRAVWARMIVCLSLECGTEFVDLPVGL
jgi:hypothetical protein